MAEMRLIALLTAKTVIILWMHGIFAKLIYLRRLLYCAGILEAVLLLLYFLCNIRQIQKLLQVINDYFKADRAYIFLHDKEKDVFIDTYEYDAPNVQCQMPTMPEIPASMLVRGIKAFNAAKVYYIPDIEQEKGH